MNITQRRAELKSQLDQHIQMLQVDFASIASDYEFQYDPQEQIFRVYTKCDNHHLLAKVPQGTISEATRTMLEAYIDATVHSYNAGIELNTLLAPLGYSTYNIEAYATSKARRKAIDSALAEAYQKQKALAAEIAQLQSESETLYFTCIKDHA